MIRKFGRPILQYAFGAIEARWGPAEIARLRTQYLE
jgi:hypothetical protein